MRSLGILTLLAGCYRVVVDPVCPSDDQTLCETVDTDAEDTGAEECLQALVPGHLMASPYCEGNVQVATELADQQLFQVKMDGGNVLVSYTSNSLRFTVANDAAFESWWGNTPCPVCDNMVEVEFEIASPIVIGGNVTVKPGVFLVKLASDDTLYVVDQCGTVRSVTPEIAEAIYGSDYTERVRTIADVFFTDFRIGPPVTDQSDYNLQGALDVTLDAELLCASSN